MTDMHEGPHFQDEMQKAVFNQISGMIEERNKLVDQANAMSGDRMELSESLTESSDDPDIVQARQARDQAIMRLHELVQPKVEEIIANAEESSEQVHAQIKELDAKIRPATRYYKQIYTDGSDRLIPKAARVKGGAKSGSGGRRIRGYEWTVQVEGEQPLSLDNAASVAKHLSVDTDKLQEAFFQAAGNPGALKDAPDTVQFNASITDVDEAGNEVPKTAQITATRV